MTTPQRTAIVVSGSNAVPMGFLNIDAIAEAYWHLHGQRRSAWTHELDVRPFTEKF